MLAWLSLLPALLLALAALVLVLVGAGLVWRAFQPGDERDGFSLRWQVGGFGAPGKGWRLSTPLTQLLAGLVMMMLAAAIALPRLPAEPEARGGAPAKAKTEAEAAASAASAASR